MDARKASMYSREAAEESRSCTIIGRLLTVRESAVPISIKRNRGSTSASVRASGSRKIWVISLRVWANTRLMPSVFLRGFAR